MAGIQDRVSVAGSRWSPRNPLQHSRRTERECENVATACGAANGSWCDLERRRNHAPTWQRRRAAVGVDRQCSATAQNVPRGGDTGCGTRKYCGDFSDAACVRRVCEGGTYDRDGRRRMGSPRCIGRISPTAREWQSTLVGVINAGCILYTLQRNRRVLVMSASWSDGDSHPRVLH
eukprot:m.863025 g.863025  ORF g.863025 m.863025 type:complete len:176 (-) comp23539_c0_seq7:137-664(-)